MKEHSFSIIIPVALHENCEKTLAAIKKINYNRNKVEVILVHGNQPSLQRNMASLKAKNEILYFLDNDSLPERNNLKQLNRIFNQYASAAVAGGPSLSPESDSLLQKAISIVLSSFAGSAFSRSRYARIGKTRESSELELILCNMAVKKDIFKKFKGFNTSLYPNEENELINRIKEKKYKVYYIPDLIVFRSQRDKVRKFVRQIFTYGRGRGEQVYVHHTSITLFPFISLCLDLYLLSLLFIHNPFWTLPSYFYLISLFFMTAYETVIKENAAYALYLPLLFLIIHSFYGIGFVWGLARSLLRLKNKKQKTWFKVQVMKKN